MRAADRIVLDPLGGYALLGEVRVPLREAGPAGELQVGGPHGPILRALSFGERTRVVTRAAGLTGARQAVAEGILRAATVRTGDADRLVQQILALALAGAGEEGPSFAETALRVARAAGMDLLRLDEAEAGEIDRLAIYLGGGTESEAVWSRISFAAPAEGELETLRDELADSLLARGTPLQTNRASLPSHPALDAASAEAPVRPSPPGAASLVADPHGVAGAMSGWEVGPSAPLSGTEPAALPVAVPPGSKPGPSLPGWDPPSSHRWPEGAARGAPHPVLNPFDGTHADAAAVAGIRVPDPLPGSSRSGASTPPTAAGLPSMRGPRTLPAGGLPRWRPLADAASAVLPPAPRGDAAEWEAELVFSPPGEPPATTPIAMPSLGPSSGRALDHSAPQNGVLEVADALAEVLQAEADLRGVDP